MRQSSVRFLVTQLLCVSFLLPSVMPVTLRAEPLNQKSKLLPAVAQLAAEQQQTRAPREPLLPDQPLVPPQSLIPTFGSLTIPQDLTVGGTTTVDNLVVNGTITAPGGFNIGDLLVLTDGSGGQSCIVFRQPDLFEKGRICSSPVYNVPGIRMSVDGGVTQNLQITNSGTVSVARDLQVGMTAYPHDLNVTDSATVGGLSTLQATNIYGHLNVTQTKFFTRGTPGVAKNVLLVTKGDLTGPDTFYSVKAAVDSITDSSVTNPYAVVVGPGVFDESETIVLKEYVSLIGQSQEATILRVTDPSKDVIHGCDESYVANLKMEGAIATGSAGARFTTGGKFELNQVEFGSNDICMYVDTTGGPATVIWGSVIIEANAEYTIGVKMAGAGADIAAMKISNFTWVAETNTKFSKVFDISGPNARFVGSGIDVGSPTFFGGTGFEATNGASINMQASSFHGFDTAIYAPPVGAGTSLSLVGVAGRGNVMDVNITHTAATGTINGVFARERTHIEPTSVISLFLTDPEDQGTVTMGPVYMGDTMPTVTNMSPVFEYGLPLGVMDGGVLSSGGGYVVNIASGSGYLMYGDHLVYITWDPASIDLGTLPTPQINSDNYFYVYYDGNLLYKGTVATTTGEPNALTTINLGKARTGGGVLVFLQEQARESYRPVTDIDSLLRNGFGAIYESGSLVSKNGDLGLNVSEGEYYFGTHEYLPSGGSPLAGWSAWYHAGAGVFTVAPQTLVDYTQYDNGTGLTGITPTWYARHAFYVVGDGATERYELVYAQDQHAAPIDAGTLPVPPGTWNGNIALLASILVQNTGDPTTGIVEICDERPRLAFKASSVSGVTVHDDLTDRNLNANHPQYLTIDGSRAMAADLPMGGNSITGANLVNGVVVENHHARHGANSVLDPLDTAAPVDIGTANTIGTANEFSRADHVHNHGNLPGGALHADATTAVAGFMSAADKTKLNGLNSADYLHLTGGTMTGSLILAPTANMTVGGTTTFALGLGVVHSSGAGLLTSSQIVDADIDPTSNTYIGAAAANAATNLNTPNEIVKRDGSGNFAAGTITANLSGNATTATTSTDFTGSLAGDVTGTQTTTVVGSVGGQTATNVAAGTVLANNATNVNTANQIVRRDGSGNFSAGNITANLLGNATTATSAGSFSGSLAGDVTGTQSATVVATVGGQTAANVAAGTVLANNATNLNIANQLVKRDGSGNFSAGTITANLLGNATTANSFTGSLTGDVTGTQGATVVALVGGQTAANVAAGTVLANSATNLNTANQIVKRDSSGNFSAGTITANLNGNATTATSAGSFSGSLAGDVTGTQSATVVATVGGQSAANIAAGTVLANNATAVNTANQIIKRDASGNFSAGTITANLNGNATTSTTATNFSGPLVGDVTGTQGATIVSLVGGQTAANVAAGTVLANNATNLDTANQLVKRDGSGNFSAGTITANLLGNATTANSFTGSLTGDVTGTQGATVVALVGGQTAANVAAGTVLANSATNLNTANQIVKRDSSGNFSAETITANLNGNATTATSAGSFSGSLAGDVTGTQSATVVATVGGQSAANIAAGTALANNATAVNTANQIVKRDASGNFVAGTITANLLGNATTANSFTGSLTGDVTGTQEATVVSFVGGQTAVQVAAGVVLANSATNLNTANQIVKRDASGNFLAGTINGVTIQTHAARHLPISGADPLTTAAPVTIGTSNAIGSADAFARSDHVHAHGAQTDGSLHAVATTSVNGFMSAADKLKLNGLDAGDYVIKAGDTMTGSLVLSGGSTNLTVGGTTTLSGDLLANSGYTFAQGVPGIPVQVLQVTKGTLHGPNQFNSVKTAVDSITDSSVTKPYAVVVGPGVFDESETIELKEYVSLIGQSQEATILRVTDPSQDVIHGCDESYVANLKMEGATATGSAGVRFTTGGKFELNQVEFGSNDTCMYVDATGGRADVIWGSAIIEADAEFVTGIKVTSAGGNAANMKLSNFTWLARANSIFSTVIDVSGADTTFVGSGIDVGSPTFFSGTGFTVTDGAAINLQGCSFHGFATAISVPAVGAGPSVSLTSVAGRGNTTDVNIAHPDATGTINGVFDRTKVVIVAGSPLSIFFSDSTNSGTVTAGPLYEGNEVGTITNISNQIQQGANLGLLSGGTFTAGVVPLTCDVAAGSGYVMAGTSPNYYLKYVEWNPQTGIALTDNTGNFIYIDNTGSLTASAHASSTAPDPLTTILLGKINTSGGAIIFPQKMPDTMTHTASELNYSWTQALGPIYVSGSTVTENDAPTIARLNASEGRYFYGTNEYQPAGGTGITWTSYYKSGVSGAYVVLTGQSQVDYSRYNKLAGGVWSLDTIPSGEYVRHGFYVVNGTIGSGGEQYLMVYGQTPYPSVTYAETFGAMPIPPNSWTGNVTPIASFIVPQDPLSSTPPYIAVILDERPRVGVQSSAVSGTVTQHDDLSGRNNDGNHPQYLLISGTRAMTGGLQMGTNNITGAGTVNDVRVESHASRHLPISGADPLATAVPVDIGTANALGTADFFSRSNHVHNHADQPGGSLHALATANPGGVAGFMSAADKTLLNSINPTLYVLNTGSQSMTGPLAITDTGLNSFNVGAGNFVIDGGTGNTTVGGTLGVTGVVTLSNLGLGVVHSSGVGLLTSSQIVDADIDPTSSTYIGAALANAATNLNTASQIVRRDASGNFSAGNITANLLGNATTATSFTGSLAGDVTGTQGATVVSLVGGQTATNVAAGTVLANAATSANTVSTIVRRDSSGNFSAGTITANLNGNATTATSATSFTGSLAGDVTGTQGATVVASVGGQSAVNVAAGTVLANNATAANTTNQIVKRDASGNFVAGTITASLNGNATTATTAINATNFTGALLGDVTGTQGATVVALVGGQTAANVAAGTALANAATSLNTVSQIVRRDGSGNFSAGNITANLLGNATTATSFTGSLVGDVTGTQGATVVALVGGQTAINVAAGTALANAATNANTASTIVRRDPSGNFSAGNITANLLGNATTATSFTGSLAGDVTGTQGATVVASVGGQSAVNVAAGTVLANNATAANTTNQIVKRDASGNFVAGTITASLNGNATTATTAINATNFTGALLGDVTGTQGATVVALVGGQTAANVAAGTVLANAATSLNTVSQIVRRDGSGNFSAGNITANLLGNATTATSFTGSLAGDVTGTQGATVVALVGGQSATNVAAGTVLANAATSANTTSTIVRRDPSGNFSAGNITANLLGNATTATSFTGSLAGDVTGTQGATTVALVGGQTAANVAAGTVLANNATAANTANQIVKRDALGNFVAGTITASLNGNATTATTATSFSGPLLGDVTGTQGATVVSLVGGQTAANVAAGTVLANNATNLNTASQIVRRDASGNFSAGTITANLIGNVTGSASLNVLKAGDTMTGALLMGNQNQLRLGDTGVNYVAMRAPTTLPSSYTLTYPTTAGASGQVLSTDGSGNLSWIANGGGGGTAYYVSAYVGSGLTLPSNTTVTVPFSVEVLDSNNNFNPATYTYTAPLTGIYWVGVNLTVINSSNYARRVEIYKNGSALTGYSIVWSTSNNPISLMGVVSLAAGNTLTVGYTGRAADLIQATDTSINIYKIG